MIDRAGVWCRALCAAIVAFDLTYVLPGLSPTRVLWYLPLARRWSWAVHPSVLGMDWYGRTLLAGGAALIAFVVAAAFRRTRIEMQSLVLWSGWAGIATLLTLALQVFQLVTRHPVPEPLPAWYQPR